MFIKPAPGVQVRYPPPNQRRVLPESGAGVPEESYWLRRLRAGDVVLAEQIPDSSTQGEVKADE